jgi:hypothetical protein
MSGMMFLAPSPTGPGRQTALEQGARVAALRSLFPQRTIGQGDQVAPV